MAVEFNLPGSSFDELRKILQGYSHASEQASLDELSKLTGLHATAISRSNKFLSDVGLITGGARKSATPLGKSLGRALEHGQGSDVAQYWRAAVQSNDKIAGLLKTVRIKGGMTEKDFSSHALYVSGQKNTSYNRTGSRCVADILLTAGLLSERDGKLVATDPTADGCSVTDEIEPRPDMQLAASTQTPLTAIPASPLSSSFLTSLTPQIAINVQLHLPETENAEVYEKLFKALRENLLDPKSA